MDDPVVDVFFSYARPDRPLVKRLVERCQAEGWSVWWDHALDSGDEFAQSIQHRLQTAKCVVVCWSSSASASRWVRDEADIAVARGVAVPVSLDGSLPPLGFGQFHTPDVSPFVTGRSDAAEVVDTIRRTIVDGRISTFSDRVLGRGGKRPSTPLVVASGLVVATLLVATATFSVGALQDYLKPAAPTRFAQLRKAEILMSEIDDFMTVVVNGRATFRAQFGEATNWTDVTSYFKKGANTVSLMIENGQYGGCGGKLQLRLNGFVAPDNEWKFGTAAGNTEGKAPNVICYSHVFAVPLE